MKNYQSITKNAGVALIYAIGVLVLLLQLRSIAA